MKKSKLSLQPSEGLVFQVAGQIYAAYITMGKVTEGMEKEGMERAVREAAQLAEITDRAVQSDDEFH